MGKIKKDKTTLIVLVIFFSFLTFVIVTYIIYSEKRFLIYNNIFISEDDPNSPLIDINDTLFCYKNSTNKVHFIYGNPIMKKSVEGLKLLEYRCSIEDTASVFSYKNDLSIAILDISIFRNIDLSKTEIKRGIIPKSPFFVLESAISLDEVNEKMILYHIPRKDFSRLLIKIPSLGEVVSCYQSVDSCKYFLNTNKIIIKAKGKGKGHLFFHSEKHKTNVYLKLVKYPEEEFKLIVACSKSDQIKNGSELELIIGSILNSL